MIRASSARQSPDLTYTPVWLARIPLHVRALAIVVLLALLLRLWPLFGLATDYDEGVYWQSLRAMANGQPLFAAIFSSQPPFFLLGLYPFYLLFGQTLVAARLAIALYSLAGVVALYFAGRALAGGWTGVFAAALLALDPLYLVASRTLQAEAPAIVFQIACVALAAEAARRIGRTQRVLAAAGGVALGLGLMTKLFDVVALPPALLYLVSLDVHREGLDAKGQSSGRWRLDVTASLRRALPVLGLFAAGVVAAIAVVLLPFVAHLDAVYDQVVRFHSVAAQAVDRGLGYNVKALLRTGELYPVSLLALFALGLALRRRAGIVLPPLAWLLGAMVLLLQQQPLFDHHRVLLVPPLALLAALALPLAAQRFAGGSVHFWRVTPPALSEGAALGLIVAVLLVNATLDVRSDRAASAGPTPLQVQMASALASFTIPRDLVASDDQYVAGQADRSVPPQLVDTSMVRIESGYLTTRQVEDLLTRTDTRVVLFASGRFDLLPGFRAWVKAHFTKITDFPNGGALYLKGPQPPQIT